MIEVERASVMLYSIDMSRLRLEHGVLAFQATSFSLSSLLETQDFAVRNLPTDRRTSGGCRGVGTEFREHSFVSHQKSTPPHALLYCRRRNLRTIFPPILQLPPHPPIRLLRNRLILRRIRLIHTRRQALHQRIRIRRHEIRDRIPRPGHPFPALESIR